MPALSAAAGHRFTKAPEGRQVYSLGRKLAAGSDLWLTAEKVGRRLVGHQPLAGGGESRRPKGVRNPRNERSHRGRASLRAREKSIETIVGGP